ncbi:MAG TPA: AAA family ATPase [Acidimicrobiales bacterium]|nr:AAA family ATPase [Acidimicrobiales bacterium]
MTVPADDIVERGRAIFEQLRRQEQEPVDAAAERPPMEENPGPAPELGAGEDVVADEADGVVSTAEAHTGVVPAPETPDLGADAALLDHPSDTAEDAEAGPNPTVDAPDPAEGRDGTGLTVDTPTDGPASAPERGPVPLGLPPDAAPFLDPKPATAELPSPTRFVRELPRVIAIANQKGGVGKTTTAVNLGAGLAELGYRVLVVDLDPQGNATTGLGINPRNLEVSVYDVMMHDVALEDCIEPTSLRNLFVCPATIDLAGAEIELVPAFSRELKLRRALDPVLDDFDFVVIDCPPSLGLITVNALAAASEVVVPIQCEYYALEGLGQLLRNVSLVQANLNARLEVSAIVLTMFDARTKLAEQVASEVRSHFGDKVCRNIVPRTVRLSEAPSFGQPIIVFDPTSRGAIAYRELAKEVSGGAPQRVG